MSGAATLVPLLRTDLPGTFCTGVGFPLNTERQIPAAEPKSRAWGCSALPLNLLGAAISLLSEYFLHCSAF